MRLHDKVAVITGAAAGMGRPMATLFAALWPAVLEATDIAAVALFLASDDSRRINGAIITADGGWGAV